jgi:hypothetical protein
VGGADSDENEKTGVPELEGGPAQRGAINKKQAVCGWEWDVMARAVADEAAKWRVDSWVGGTWEGVVRRRCRTRATREG